MSPTGNVPAEVLVDAVERVVAQCDDRELADAYAESLLAMQANARDAVVEAVFDAFRERGESSEDAAEGSGVALAQIHFADPGALRALVEYAGQNADLLKEATVLFVERHPGLVDALPPLVGRALHDRLAQPAS
jgi:hypothetical protein